MAQCQRLSKFLVTGHLSDIEWSQKLNLSAKGQNVTFFSYLGFVCAGWAILAHASTSDNQPMVDLLCCARVMSWHFRMVEPEGENGCLNLRSLLCFHFEADVAGSEAAACTFRRWIAIVPGPSTEHWPLGTVDLAPVPEISRSRLGSRFEWGSESFSVSLGQFEVFKLI